MVPPGQSAGVLVDLAPMWTAWDQVRQEHERLADYVAAHAFWVSYERKLRDSSALITQVRTDMEANTGWRGLGDPRSAATAFYGSVDAGVGSIRRWLDGGTAAVGDTFGMLVERLGAHHLAIEEQRLWLLRQDKVVDVAVVPDKELVTTPTMATISEQDRGPVAVPSWNAGNIAEMVADAVRRRDELRDLFGRARRELDALPHTEKWQGPAEVAPDLTAAGDPVPGGAGGASGGPPGPGGADAPGPAGPEASGPAAPTSPGATPDLATEPPGGGRPDAGRFGADVPGRDQPGVPVPVDEPGSGVPSTPRLPVGDPELAGAPSATVPPPARLPGSVPNLPAAIPGSAGFPGPSAALPPLPFVPSGVAPTTAPTTAAIPVRRDGTQPFPPVSGGADVDRSPPAGAPLAEDSPPRSRGGTAGSNAGAGQGVYPPMMPPMMPPMGGAGAGGIRPGEAEFAGGPVRQAGGRDSWRAGLRPQLVGRTGVEDDEPHHFPPVSPLPGGDVLDEELWQVSDAAPAALPEPPRRHRSWGPG